MAGWITHLMIADALLETNPALERRGFCVGSIAPDCNVESADWKSFTPPREVTHWMQGKQKAFSDAERFRKAHLHKKQAALYSPEQLSFLLGYYAHLLTDAAYATMLHEERRTQTAWERIQKEPVLRQKSAGMEASWDAVKKLVDKETRQREVEQFEAEYLLDHPRSGYWTEILPLQTFPDYLDYLPHGCIVRKIQVMGKIPQKDKEPVCFLAVSREELLAFVQDATVFVSDRLRETYNG